MEGRHNKGFTVAEMLMVVAIMGVLFGLAFLAVYNHFRSLTKKEYDEYSREIFVAAQNNLSMASHELYLGFEEPENRNDPEHPNPYGNPDPNEEGVFYFKVHVSEAGSYEFKNSLTETDQSVLDLMLPFGSLDETIRMGGSYIIRYHKDSGTVLDVFYWEESGTRYDHTYSTEPDYETFLANKENKPFLRNYDVDPSNDNSVIGYYGGADASNLTRGDELESPLLIVKNAERLTATIKIKNTLKESDRLKLIVTGLTSGRSKEILVDHDAINGTKKYEYVLDDVTVSGGHFHEKFSGFIEGENIQIQAILYNNTVLTNIGKSAIHTTNSLFGGLKLDGAGNTQDTALIKNFRHLENLGNNVSSLDNAAKKHLEGSDEKPIWIKKAEQTTDLDWVEFCKAIKSDKPGDVQVYGCTEVETNKGCYMPIIPTYDLEYDGRKCSISQVKVEVSDKSAGLIGEANQICRVKDMRLIDFSITTTGDSTRAGCLAGIYKGFIDNVICYNINNSSGGVSAGGSAGGLVGELDNGRVMACGAAVYVNSSNGAAGGLIGASNGVTTDQDPDDYGILYSFSGGHTSEGVYPAQLPSGNTYDVTGVIAGGLVGSFCDPESGLFSDVQAVKIIKGCYSTCSVSGIVADDQVTTVGGLVGIASGTIQNCYSTGYVKFDESDAASDTIYAFAGKGVSLSLLDNKYLMTINEIKTKDENGKVTDISYMAPYKSATLGITPIDSSAQIYDTFVGAESGWSEAVPYDNKLLEYYNGKYTFKTVDELFIPKEGQNVDNEIPTDYFVRKHYGDWPAPEIFIINTSAS